MRISDWSSDVCSSDLQMCIDNKPTEGFEIIATAKVADVKKINKDSRHDITVPDIEAFFYRDTCCLGFQGHHEYKGYNAYTLWFTEKIRDYIRSEEHTSELQSLMRISYAVFSMKKKKK